MNYYYVIFCSHKSLFTASVRKFISAFAEIHCNMLDWVSRKMPIWREMDCSHYNAAQLEMTVLNLIPFFYAGYL